MKRPCKLLHRNISNVAATDTFLPAEFWMDVASRLVAFDGENALEPLSLVCKESLLASNSLRRKLTLYVTADDGEDCSSEAELWLARLIRKPFSSLEEIDLIIDNSSERTDANVAAIDYAISEISCCSSNFKKLKTVSLFFSCCVPPCESLFGRFTKLRDLSWRLKTLKISVCGIEDQDLKQISECFPLLEEFSVSVLSDPYRACYVSDFNVTDVGIQFLSSKLKYLSKIQLYGRSISDDSIVALASNCILLRELAIIGNTKVTVSGIGYVLCHCPKLVSLSLTGYYSGDVPYFSSYHVYDDDDDEPPPVISSYTIENSISYANQLQSLALSSLVGGDNTLQSIVSADLPLKSLSFGSGHCSLSGLTQLLQAYPSLSCLHIWDNVSITNEALVFLCEYFQSLTCITLSGRTLTNESFVILAKNCPSLESIQMHDTSLGKGDFDTSIGKNAKINHLKFSCLIHLDDQTLENIGLTCPNLQRLIIKLCHKIAPKGITKILKTCDKVRVLSLSYYRFSEILDVESEALELDLEELAIQKSWINDKALANIGKMCQRLQKINLYGSHIISSAGVLDFVERCNMLKEINLKYCSKLQNTDIKSKIFNLRPLLRVSCSPGL